MAVDARSWRSMLRRPAKQPETLPRTRRMTRPSFADAIDRLLATPTSGSEREPWEVNAMLEDLSWQSLGAVAAQRVRARL